MEMAGAGERLGWAESRGGAAGIALGPPVCPPQALGGMGWCPPALVWNAHLAHLARTAAWESLSPAERTQGQPGQGGIPWFSERCEGLAQGQAHGRASLRARRPLTLFVLCDFVYLKIYFVFHLLIF